MTNHSLSTINLPTAKHLLLGLIVFITFFINNRVIEPDIMESRNLVTAREMVEKGNIIIPTMNDELRLEKPPLPTWISAVVEAVSPNDIGAQRAVASLAGILLVIYFYRTARRVLDIDPVWATILLCTCYNFMLMARTVSWDIYCHAFMMAGIYYFSVAVIRSGHQWRSFAAAGLFTGLSILSKGPVSLFALFLPYLIAFGVFIRPSMKGKWGGVTMLTLIALVVGGWWYAYVHIFHTDAWQSVVSRESGAWMNRNVRPWYYYHKFYLEAGLWAVMLITSVLTTAFMGRRLWGRRGFTAFMWMVFSLILLSLIPEKKNRYLFPILIPAALMMAQTAGAWSRSFINGRRPGYFTIPFRINSWLLAICAFALPVAAWVMIYDKGYATIYTTLIFGAVSVAAGIMLAIWAMRLRPGRMIWTAGGLYAAAITLMFPATGNLINNPDMTGLDRTVGMKELDGIPMFYNSAEELRIELVYAARRDIRPIDIIDSAAVAAARPFAYLSHTGASELPAQVIADSDTLSLGIFDCNRRPKGTRRYSQTFIYRLTIVAPRDSAITKTNTPTE